MAASSSAQPIGASNNNEEKRVSLSSAPVPLNRKFLESASAKLTRISITGGETKTISGVPKEVKEIVDRVLSDNQIELNAQYTYPIAHKKIVDLVYKFLAYKKNHGSSVEKKLYQNMEYEAFIQRLLTKRPCRFVNSSDDATLWFGSEIPPENGFDKIGTEEGEKKAAEEKSSLRLANYISYDEMQISALLGLSSPTKFINDGDRGNRGKLDEKKPHESRGIYVGLVGPRFERQGLMDWQHIVITSEQNTPENGYGANAEPDTDISSDAAKAKAAKIAKNRMWAEFYGVLGGNFPLFEDVANSRDNARFIPVCSEDKKSEVKSDVPVKPDYYINLPVYKVRMRMVIEPYLLEANDRAQAENKPAYVHSAGLGLEFFLGSLKNASRQNVEDTSIQDVLVDAMIDVFKEVISDNQLSWIGDIDLGHLPVASKEKSNGFREEKLGEFKDVLGHGINLRCSTRNPAAKLPDSENRLLVANFAWDANAFVGNEFWIGSLNASGDPACCSGICVTQNPVANPGAMERSPQLFDRPLIIKMPLQGDDFFEILWDLQAGSLTLNCSSPDVYSRFTGRETNEQKETQYIWQRHKLFDFFENISEPQCIVDSEENKTASEFRLLRFLVKESISENLKSQILEENVSSTGANAKRAKDYLRENNFSVQMPSGDNSEAKLKCRAEINYIGPDSYHCEPVIALTLAPPIGSDVLSVLRNSVPITWYNPIQENDGSMRFFVSLNEIDLFIENVKHVHSSIITDQDKSNLEKILNESFIKDVKKICSAPPAILNAKWDEKKENVTLTFSSILQALGFVDNISPKGEEDALLKNLFAQLHGNDPVGFSINFPVAQKGLLLNFLAKVAKSHPEKYDNYDAIVEKISGNNLQLNADASASSSQDAPKKQADVKDTTPDDKEKKSGVSSAPSQVTTQLAAMQDQQAHSLDALKESKLNNKKEPPEDDVLSTSSEALWPRIEWVDQPPNLPGLVIKFESNSAYREFVRRMGFMWNSEDSGNSGYVSYAFRKEDLLEDTSIFKRLLRVDETIVKKIAESENVPSDVKELLAKIQAQAAQARSFMMDTLRARLARRAQQGANENKSPTKGLRVNTKDENESNSTPSSSPVNSPVGTPSPSVLSPARGAHVSSSRDGFTQRQNIEKVQAALREGWEFSEGQKDSSGTPFYKVTERKGEGEFYIQPKTIVSSDNNVETFKAMLTACQKVHGELRPPTIFSDDRDNWINAFQQVYRGVPNIDRFVVPRRECGVSASIPVAAIPQPMPSAPPLTSSSSHLTRTAPPGPSSSGAPRSLRRNST